MKRVLSTLVISGLLIGAPLAYGMVGDQDTTKENKPVIAMSQKKKNEPVLNNGVTWQQFAAELAAKLNINLDELTQYALPADQAITYEQAAQGVVQVLQQQNIKANPFNKEQDAVTSLFQLGIIAADSGDVTGDDLITKEAVEQIAGNLNAVLNLKPGDKTINGVSYLLTPLSDNKYSLELLWGRKSSSGYRIKIKDTDFINDTLYVSFYTEQPKDGHAYLTVITYPSDQVTVKMPKMPHRVVLINENNQ